MSGLDLSMEKQCLEDGSVNELAVHTVIVRLAEEHGAPIVQAACREYGIDMSKISIHL